MEALGKDARRLLELTKRSYEPPALAKGRLRARLDAKLAATTVLGATGLANKAALAQLVLPASKALFVSLVLVGAASVGYVSAPTLRVPHPARSSPSQVTATMTEQHRTDRASHEAAAMDPAALASSEPEPESAPESELATTPRRDLGPISAKAALLATATSISVDPPRGSLAPISASELDQATAQPATVPTSQPEGAPLEPAPLDDRAGSQLADETRLIREAHRAILKGEPSTALELLADHERRFASAALAQERDAARIMAICRLRRTEEARLRWARFIATWPGSPLIDRIRASCQWEN